MLREYQLTNFKAFAGPETIPIRPITLIYGPNSSGKSSILQSLLLLKQTLEEAQDSATLLLPRGTLVDLGSYREFVHRHEVNNKFSFKVAFDPRTKEARPFRVRKLLEAADPASVGLQVTFFYDGKAGNILLSSVEMFIGEQLLPMIVYEPGELATLARAFKANTPESDELNTLLERHFPDRDPNELRELFDRSLSVRKINFEHLFWQAWWGMTKEYVREELSQSQATFAYREQEDREGWEYISDLKGGGEEKILELLEDYPFEKAIEDFKDANQALFLGLRNFLPSEVRNEPHTDSPFDVRWFYPDLSDNPSSGSETQLDISPVTFHICSLFRQFINDVVYLGPLRNDPERYYIFSGDLSEYVGKSGKMTPDVLFKHPDLWNWVNERFDRFGLGYKLQVLPLGEEGNVFGLHLVDKETGVGASIRDVGFGVSQVLPIIVQSLLSRNKTLLIEQPEIHLHPALQAELGDLFIQSALGEQRNTFILETHSEHLMLRILRRIRETTEGELDPGLTPIRPEDVAVLYVLPDKDGAKVVEIPIQPDGEFATQWPQGFFAERAEELF
jgi:hypothetical protein